MSESEHWGSLLKLPWEWVGGAYEGEGEGTMILERLRRTWRKAAPGGKGHLTFPLYLFFQGVGLSSCGMTVTRPLPFYYILLILLQQVGPEAWPWV